MIIDTLANAPRYARLHPLFAQAFDFLANSPLATMPLDTYRLDGDRLFAIVQEPQGHEPADAKIEFHRRYIDIQYVVSGDETMGYIPVEGLGHPLPFDEGRDVGFAKDAPLALFPVRPGSFAIFFPEDGHAPNIGPGIRRKVVVKVLAE